MLANPKQIRSYFTDCQEAMIGRIHDLVVLETPTSDKQRLDAFADGLAGVFTKLGAAVDIVPVAERGNHVLARYPAPNATSNVKPALVLCHLDTVWPVGSLETHPFRIEGNKAYGPGILDMQTSLVLVEFALRAVRDLQLNLPRPVTVLLNSDEEVGSQTSEALIEEEALHSAYVLVMEPPIRGGLLKTRRKGVGRFSLRVTGHPAHSGAAPQEGESAIEELAHQIIKLHGLNDLDAGTTVNVGMIEGGSAVNVVAASAYAQIDSRAWTKEEADKLEAAIYGLKPVNSKTELHIDGGWNRPPLERSATGAIFERAKQIGAQIGMDLQEGGTGGGSDGNFTGALGVPTLDGLGMPGDGAHADHEHILVDQIPVRAALLTSLLLEL
ncbi:MAG: M20 family metallopeptidase [Caldilineaceae bacterium]